jgi:hypothetical protein
LRKQWWAAASLPVVLVAVAAVFWLVNRPAPSLNLPTDAAGTALPDGLKMPEGAVLLGPVLYGTGSDPPDSWLAILAASEDPMEAWEDYHAQLANLIGEAPLEAPGCREDSDDGYRCDSRFWLADPANEGKLVLEASLINPPDDVTGRYLMVIDALRVPDPISDGTETKSGDDSAPETRRPRPVPKVGEPLAPSTVAYEGDNDRYVVLDGSELVAQWGDGSLTGGFDVLLSVNPGESVEDVATAYAEQSAQYEDETKVHRYRVGETLFTSYQPPGGAGGYQGVIYAVDQPGDRDYIYYSLSND